MSIHQNSPFNEATKTFYSWSISFWKKPNWAFMLILSGLDSRTFWWRWQRRSQVTLEQVHRRRSVWKRHLRPGTSTLKYCTLETYKVLKAGGCKSGCVSNIITGSTYVCICAKLKYQLWTNLFTLKIEIASLVWLKQGWITTWIEQILTRQRHYWHTQTKV